MLLDIEEISRRLDATFLPLEPMLTGYRLIRQHTGFRSRCESDLQISLPSSFLSVVENYNFGNFTIGPVTFGSSGDYLDWLVVNNCISDDAAYPWWGDGGKPDNLVLVAFSDSYAFILNTIAESVFAFRHGESWETENIPVATDFRLFIRGLGTSFLERRPGEDNSPLAGRVAVAVGVAANNPFWIDFAK